MAGLVTMRLGGKHHFQHPGPWPADKKIQKGPRTQGPEEWARIGFTGRDKPSWPHGLEILSVQESGLCLAPLSPLRSLFMILLDRF